MHNDPEKLAWNQIITFLLWRHFLLNKWPVSQIQFSKWMQFSKWIQMNAIFQIQFSKLNIQWFSLLEKSSKTWYYLYLPNIQCYFVTHTKTSNFMKWLTFLFASLGFMKSLPKIRNFFTWWSKFKCRLQRTCEAQEKTSFVPK